MSRRTLHGWITVAAAGRRRVPRRFGISTGDFTGDQLGLCALTVTARPAIGGVMPYAPEYRGVIDLEFGMHAS